MDAFLAITQSWEKEDLFRLELVLLLVSISLSLGYRNARPYFIASGACLLVTEYTVVMKPQQRQPLESIEVVAGFLLLGALLSTFLLSVGGRVPTSIVIGHAATAFGLCTYSVLRAWSVSQERTSGLGHGVRTYTAASVRNRAGANRFQGDLYTHRAIFSTMHMIASTLVCMESCSHVEVSIGLGSNDPVVEGQYDRKEGAMV